MASFVPNHRKKINHLEEKENEFWRLIAGGAGQDELLVAAIEVRDARVRAIRAKQNQLKPPEEIAFQRMKAAISALQSTTAEEILAELLKSGKPN